MGVRRIDGAAKWPGRQFPVRRIAQRPERLIGCRVGHVDGPRGLQLCRLRTDLTSRIKALPEFRAKLAESQLNLDHPVWVEGKNFDLSRHLHRIGLPSPVDARSSLMCVRTSRRYRWIEASRCGRCG